MREFPIALVLAGLLSACQLQGPATASAGEPFSLDGTAWRLVQIQSMDDTVFTPDVRDKYTLVFESDGTLLVRADCNRGRGTWQREGSSGLQFGPIATTRMACPPDSLHDRFLSDLGYVRSFVQRDGLVYLATMADGAILEFEPLEAAAGEPGAAAGPAFDCAEAEGRVETLICADRELAEFDRRLDGLYRQAVDRFPDDEIDRLKAYQRGWIKGRNDCWKAAAVRECVDFEYRSRITELEIRTGATIVPSPVGFVCDNGASITAVFYEETLLPTAVLTRVGRAERAERPEDEQILAFQQPAASGAKYAGPNVEFWTKGDQAQVTWMGERSRCSVR